MKIKILIALAAVLMSGNVYASTKLGLNPDQGDALVQIIINVVTFILGLFINPKKKSE